MKKVQLEVWGGLDKLCLISAITKLKTSFADQNWVAISRFTKQLYENISTLICYDKRSDEWFSPKQCAGQYEFIIKGSGARKKKRIDKNTDYSDFHDTILVSCTQEFCEELKKSMDDIREEFLKAKKIMEDVDSDKLEEETLDELIKEMVEKEKSSDIKSKLKSMLDEKNATECENSSKHLLQQTLIHSEPSTSGEQKTSITTSPLLTSLLQSPSPLVRPSSSTSSPTISLLLHSSPSVSLTDSTLSKLLETPTPLPSTSSTTTSFDAHSYIFQTGNMDSLKSSTEANKTSSARSEEVLMQREEKESDDYEKEEIFDDMSDIEQGVVESEVIIENESSPVKRLTPKRLDMEQVEDEQEEEILETVEEIIERVEEAIIETVGENNLNELVLSEDIETVSISDDEIENINMEENAYEVIVVGSQEVAEPSHDVAVAVAEEPVIIEDDNTDADKTIPDTDEAVVEKEVTNDSIPQQSFEDPSSEDVVEDESSTKFTMQETKMKQNNEKMEVSFSEKIDADDSEMQVIHEENVISRANATESLKHTQNFDSGLVESSILPSEKETTALATAKNEEIEQYSITKISKDPKDSSANCVDELSSDNFEDKLNTGKAGSGDLPNVLPSMHKGTDVDKTNEESSLEAYKANEKDLTRGNVQILSLKNETKGIMEINNQKDTEIQKESQCEEKNEAFETRRDSNKKFPNIPPIIEKKKEETDHNEQIKCSNVNEDNYDSVSDNDNDSIKQGNIEEETTLKDKTKESHLNNDLSNKNEIISEDTMKDLPMEKSVADKNNLSDKEIIILNSGEGSLEDDSGIIAKKNTFIQEGMKESELTVGDQELTGNGKKPSKEEDIITPFIKQIDAEKTPESISEEKCHVVELVPSVENVKTNSDDLIGTKVEATFPEASNRLPVTQLSAFSEEKTKVERQIPDMKNIHSLEEEHEETQESFEHYSDVLVISDEDSDSKDKSDSTEETEDNSLLLSDDSKDGLDDSLKFSSLETISTHSDSPPDLYYNDPKFAVLRSKDMELKLIMQKGFEEIKTKGEELVPSSNENEKYGKRKYFKESSKSSENIKVKRSNREEIIEKNISKLKRLEKLERNREDSNEKNISKLKQLENLEGNREKIKSKKVIKDKSGKERVEKDKLSDNKLVKIGRKTNYLNSMESKPDSPSLSTTSSDEDRDYKSWKKSILLVYNRLASHKYASVFSKPITENEAPNYHQLILRPMDLSTIKRNIENGVIRTTVEFQRDMLLMVQNAIIYNKYDTPVYDMAKVMGEDMLAQMEVMVQALGDGVPLIGDTGDEKQITRARTSKSSSDAPLKKKRKNQDPDENRPKRSKLSASSS